MIRGKKITQFLIGIDSNSLLTRVWQPLLYTAIARRFEICKISYMINAWLRKTKYILSAMLLLMVPEMINAGQKMSNQTLLLEMIPRIVQIMRRNGYEMPDYRVIDGRTDVPISGLPEKHAFFGYVDKGWLKNNQKIALYFYEADQLPISGRTELIDYLLGMYENKNGTIALTVYMTTAKYKKPQLFMPSAFLELKLNQMKR